MGKGGRLACIFTPFVLSMGAAAVLIVIFLAGIFKENKTLDDLYFMKLNMTNITISGGADLLAGIAKSDVSNLSQGLAIARQQGNLKDYYTVYLRTYCSWNAGQVAYKNCTKAANPFAFDPLEAWGINAAAASRGVNATTLIPDKLRDGLDLYRKLSHAMVYLYAITLLLVLLTLLVGISAIFSRLGSFFTTFFASLAGTGMVISSVLVTAMFPTLRGVLESTLKNGTSPVSTLGVRILALTWLATIFALAGSLFWSFSVCCCSGRSPYHPGDRDARRMRQKEMPYDYNPVGHQPAQNINMNFAMPGHGNSPMPNSHGMERQTAYEPYRQV